jgi:hypothetical protein
MPPAHGIAKDPFRFSISDKKSSDNCASTFLDLPASYLRYLNRGAVPGGRGVRRWPLRLKSLAHVRLFRCREFIASILITPAIAIFTLWITRQKFAQWIPVRSVLTQFSGGFAWTVRCRSVIKVYPLNDVSLKLLGQASILRREAPVDQEHQ